MNWGLEFSPDMGEILVAQGKRQSSFALGKNEHKETVRIILIIMELTFFWRNNIGLQKSSYIIV
jgi:hypothetical protein